MTIEARWDSRDLLTITGPADEPSIHELQWADEAGVPVTVDGQASYVVVGYTDTNDPTPHVRVELVQVEYPVKWARVIRLSPEYPTNAGSYPDHIRRSIERVRKKLIAQFPTF